MKRIGSSEMPFSDWRMTISEVIPYVWQGALPTDAADFSHVGKDVHVYALCPCEPAYFRGAGVLVRLPMHDNANDPASDPPRLVGVSLAQVRDLAERMAARAESKQPTVALCQWGYNRSGLIVGLAMARLGYRLGSILEAMKASRGPHPCGFGDPLNNHNFRALVRREAGE